MRRRNVHVVFSAVTALCAVVLVYESTQLFNARRVNASISAASKVSLRDSRDVGSRGSAASNVTAGTIKPEGSSKSKPAQGPDARAETSGVPEAQFARAFALAHSGEPDAALSAYKRLIQGKRSDLRVAALYNVGNLHMREAQRKSAEDATQLLPLIELAKQSYRDVLRVAPEDWNARYNLERALQLAPEFEDAPVDDDLQEAPEEHVSSTLQGAKMDLP